MFSPAAVSMGKNNTSNHFSQLEKSSFLKSLLQRPEDHSQASLGLRISNELDLKMFGQKLNTPNFKSQSVLPKNLKQRESKSFIKEKISKANEDLKRILNKGGQSPE